jgi:hypothetical protein
MVDLITSVLNGSMMPPLGRSLQDVPGAALVTSWIVGLDGGGLDAGIDGGCG